MKKILLPACLALALAPLSAQEPAAEPGDGLWRPAPHKTNPPYPKKAPREPRESARLSTMTLDGTFESFDLNSVVHEWADEFTGSGTLFGGVHVRKGGYPGGAGQCITIPPANFGVLGFEEKNIPLKPNTWYRVEFMARGVPYRMEFNYPRVAPDPENPRNDSYLNKIIVDHNYGSHDANFCYVCAECGFVKWGTPEDGKWFDGGFRELPEKCPKCDADGKALYRDGARRPYYDWTLVYEDFRTSDYVGMMAGAPYYWSMVAIGWDCALSFDNFMVYEITGEGGEAVGGDVVTDLAPSGKLLPPHLATADAKNFTPEIPARAGDPVEDAAAFPVEFFFSPQRPVMVQETAKAINAVRQRIADEWGVPPPFARFTVRADLGANEAAIDVLGETAWQGEIPPAVEGEGALAAETAAAVVMAGHLAEVYKLHAQKLLTLKDTRVLVNRVAERGPLAVAEAEKALGLDGIRATLCALLAGGQSVLQLPVIMDALATESLVEKDPALLAEKVMNWLLVQPVE